MNIEQANMTVIDYLNACERAEVTVNKNYQRNPGRWPAAAQAFFIETIMRAFPIPRLALFTTTDVKARRTVKEIVDGQQRTHALQSFFTNALALPKVPGTSYGGRRFQDLGEEDQRQFMSYLLPIEVYVGATYADVREVFRRINAYTASLTPEEKRHARFQGPFKWFVHRFALAHAQALIDMGVLSEHQVHRMEDVKLLAEASHALLHGITTTNSRSLDKLYADHDDSFAAEEAVRTHLTMAVEGLLQLRDIHKTRILKPYQAYALILALAHTTAPIAALSDVVPLDQGSQLDAAVASRGLLALAAAIEDPDEYPQFQEFVAASETGTNVAEKRKVRFRYFCRAIAGEIE